MKWINLCWLFVFIVFLADFSNSLGDPYKILGIPKSATVTEIRKSYKQLAKEWYVPKYCLLIVIRNTSKTFYTPRNYKFSCNNFKLVIFYRFFTGT